MAEKDKKVDEYVEKLFAKLDTDKRGKIDRRELKAFLVSAAKEEGLAPPTDKDVSESKIILTLLGY